MRFTRIPLIATLLAGALSLLVVLPAIAQSTQGVETDGRESVGGALEVQVYQNIADIANRGIAAVDSGDRFGQIGAGTEADPYRSSAKTTAEDAGLIARGDEALGLRDEDSTAGYSRIPNPRNTRFNGRVYVSNDGENNAYNTVLITAQVPDGAESLVTLTNDGTADPPITDGWTALLTGANADCAMAKAKNTRSGKTSDIVLFAVNSETGTATDRQTGDSPIANNHYVFQGVLTVWDRGVDRVEEYSSSCVAQPVADPAIQTDPNDPWDAVTADGTNQPAAVMAARDGDTIEITVPGVRGRLTLTVDGDEPTLTGLTPEDGGTTNSDRVTLGFTVSDDGSGLRFDAEDGMSGDGDSSPANGDNDQRYNEPLTKGDPPDNAGDGSTADIQVYYNADSLTDASMDAGFQYTAAEEYSRYGTNGWTEVALGRTYRLAMILNSQEFGDYEWQIVAKDRVGNTVTTDGNDDDTGDQPFTFSLDDEDPVISEVRTGVRFDSNSNPPKEKADRSWIALSIANENVGGEDRVARSSVQASDFTVSGATVVAAFVPTSKKVCKVDDSTTDADESEDNIYNIDGSSTEATMADPNCDFDPRARIYLQLSEELDADETPTVQTLGGVFQDVAGNNNRVESLSGSSSRVVDKIQPGVTITVTATGEATNRAATNDDGEFTIRVESDEDLSTFPRFYFAEIDGTALGATGDDENVATSLQVAGEPESVTPRELERRVWERAVDESDFPGSGPRLIAVLVTAEDENDNQGNSDGWSGSAPPAAGTKLDFNKLDDGGFLIEVDSDPVAAPTVTVQPPAPGETKITESLTPYVELDFSGEKNEYGIADREDGSNIFYKGFAGDDEDAIKTDSHETIKLTKLEVDGVDRRKDVRQVGSNKGKFIIAFVEGLSIGKHEIVYAATDDVGNELAANSAGDNEGKYTFTVQAREGYRVSLRPGWNLISLPGTPENPAVSAVLDDMEANTVLSYQEGEWLSAIRPDGGEWQGTLEQIVGGYGYWVQTTAAETITAVIPPTLPNQVLPTVPITSGWNLVGVIDAAQSTVGADDAKQDPDKYFVNVSWRVAYGFETQGSRWVKILPKPSGTDDGTNDDAIENGSGYWLWSTEPGVLVP